MTGMTGCGKTLAAHTLAQTLKEITGIDFGFIRIDCNLYMESHRISNFLSAPPSYKDSGEPSLFTPIIDQPYTVVLFDEVEKSHPNVLKSLMGIFDYSILQLSSPLKEKDKDGNVIKGNEGKEGIREICFKRTIIVMTSNLDLDPDAKRIGFAGGVNDDSLVSAEDRCKEALHKKAGVLPEIAGRISYFLQFEALTDEHMREIVRCEIEKCAVSFGLSAVEISDTILDEIVAATGKRFGARAHVQLIERVCGLAFVSYADPSLCCRQFHLAEA